jgi:hypothetical protein
MMNSYIVICRDDTQPSGERGRWIVAGQHKLPMDEKAAVEHAKGISPSREPMVCKLCGAGAGQATQEKT